MERLTKRTPAGVGVLTSCGTGQHCRHCRGVCQKQDIANTRLAEYEDTGLTPEEIKRALDAANQAPAKKEG